MKKKCQIKIYSYKDKNPRGYLYHAAYPEAKPFWGLTQLLFLLDDLPETEEEVLGFRPEIRGAMATVQILEENGKGRVLWVENKEEIPFESTMAFVRTLDAILTKKKKWKFPKPVSNPKSDETPV